MRRSNDESIRLDYLAALGIDAWRPRGSAASASMQQEPAAEEEPESGAPSGSRPNQDWDELRRRVATCTRCELHQTRTQAVFGVGNPAADWMIVGEAPGAEEDRRGEPFVGRAGKLLDEILRAIGLDRRSVFIANILKCRPPRNRDPRPEEASECREYLNAQIDHVAPKIVLAVGRISAQQLLGTDSPVGRLRGRVHRLEGHDVPLVVTYHPAYLLRSPAQKAKVWEDLCLAKRTMAS